MPLIILPPQKIEAGLIKMVSDPWWSKSGELWHSSSCACIWTNRDVCTFDTSQLQIKYCGCSKHSQTVQHIIF